MSQVFHGDSLDVLKTIESDSVDLLCSDPPYAISFMGKAWDKALPDIGIFRECLRVLKPGAFAFVMSAPRSDVCSRMAILLEDAGFIISFTPIYWTYASGFPKAMNIGKMVDKRNGRHQPEQDFKDYLKLAKNAAGLTSEQIDRALGFKSGVFSQHYVGNTGQVEYPTVEKYRELKKLLKLDARHDEIIERTEAEREVVGQYKSDMGGLGGERIGEKGGSITTHATDAAKALDGSYGGFQPKPAVEVVIVAMKPLSEKTYVDQALKNGKGITWLDDCRVPGGDPANLKRLGKDYTTADTNFSTNVVQVRAAQVGGSLLGRFPANLLVEDDVLNDHSRFFSLDAWSKTLPFLAVAKASKSEKNRGLEARGNIHPTCKPLKLMSYLITLGSRPGDVVLDPFLGSGTTAIAAKELGRQYIGIEREADYHAIAEARLLAIEPTLI